MQTYVCAQVVYYDSQQLKQLHDLFTSLPAEGLQRINIVGGCGAFLALYSPLPSLSSPRFSPSLSSPHFSICRPYFISRSLSLSVSGSGITWRTVFVACMSRPVSHPLIVRSEVSIKHEVSVRITVCLVLMIPL